MFRVWDLEFGIQGFEITISSASKSPVKQWGFDFHPPLTFKHKDHDEFQFLT